MAKKVNITLPRISDLQIEVKLEGDWVRVQHGIDNLSPDIQKGYDKAINTFSKRILTIVKRAMASGTPPPNSGVTWEPLSPATIKRWGDHPIYYLTGLYYRSVGLFRYKSRTLVGLPISAKRASNKNLTLNQLAKILEFGNEHIPARPLWAPSLKAAGDTDKLKKEIIANIRSNLSKSFGIRPNQVRW